MPITGLQLRALGHAEQHNQVIVRPRSRALAMGPPLRLRRRPSASSAPPPPPPPPPPLRCRSSGSRAPLGAEKRANEEKTKNKDTQKATEMRRKKRRAEHGVDLDSEESLTLDDAGDEEQDKEDEAPSGSRAPRPEVRPWRPEAPSGPSNDAPSGSSATRQTPAPGGQTPAPTEPRRFAESDVRLCVAPAPADIPEYDRTWHRFPDSDVPVRVGADRKLAEGIYQHVRAFSSHVYVLLEELPDSAPEVRQAMQRWRDADKNVIVSYGTRELYDNEIAVYTAEETGHIDRPLGFLVVGGRGGSP